MTLLAKYTSGNSELRIKSVKFECKGNNVGVLAWGKIVTVLDS